MSETATGIAPPPGEAPEEDPRVVLADLRQSRRRQRTHDFDPFEALYRVYITAIVSGIAVLLLSGVTGDSRVRAAAAAHVAAHDAGYVGLAVAVCWAVGLRSGGRGGPLVIEAADVRHVLLSPLDRALALRPVALRQLRFGGLVGTGVGAIAGLLAYRRLPGGFPAWIVAGAAVGGLATTSALGFAMLVAGRRLGRWVGGGLAALVLAWSGLDVVAGTATSPATLMAQVALWPLKLRWTGLVGPAVALAAVIAGWLSVEGSSLEAAERRATLVGQIRFAATLRDLRTVVVLRRQLAQELPRQRPWFRLPRAIPAAWLVPEGPGASPGREANLPPRPRRWPVWRRGWHGILRFPALRLLRLAVLGAAAGAAAVGMWRGTAPLVVVAGVCLYMAGLDAVEPMAQDIDHPDRRDAYGLTRGELQVRQIAPSVVVMLAVAAVGVLSGYLVAGAAPRAAELGGVMWLPAALAGLAGATISVVQGAPSTFSSTDSLLPPEAAGARAVFRIVWPPVVSMLGVLPLLAARHVKSASGSPVSELASLEIPVLLILFLVGIWVRYRDPMHEWFRKAMEEAKAAQRPSATSQR